MFFEWMSEPSEGMGGPGLLLRIASLISIVLQSVELGETEVGNKTKEGLCCHEFPGSRVDNLRVTCGK